MKENKNDLMIAAAQIAAAKIAGNPSLNIDDVVREAFNSLSKAYSETISTNLSDRQIAETIGKDYLICLEDGTKHTMLRRYLKRKFNMTPEQYKSKWNLPDKYPMIAPNYSKFRSKIAKSSGLGKSESK